MPLKGVITLADNENTKRLNIIVSTELHTELKVAVARKGATIGNFVADAIREKIERDKEKE